MEGTNATGQTLEFIEYGRAPGFVLGGNASNVLQKLLVVPAQFISQRLHDEVQVGAVGAYGHGAMSMRCGSGLTQFVVLLRGQQHGRQKTDDQRRAKADVSR